MSSGSSGASKRGIPSWQRAPSGILPNENITTGPASSASTSTETNASPTTTQAKVTSPDEPLLQQALKFLNDPSIQDAPPEKKFAFLESKGLSKEHIETALNLAKVDTTEPSLPLASISPSLPPKSPSLPPTTSTAPQQEIPPIITYPEFLLKPQKPPPIITIQRLLNTAYIACGAAAIVYGASKYLLGPMTDNLTAARHEFAEHSRTQVDELNRKLGEVVTADPSHDVGRLKSAKDGNDDDDAASVAGSVDSDPTELFHRDFGTQTLPPPTDFDASSSSSDGDDNDPSSISSPTDTQTSQLTRIKSLLSDLRSDYDTDEQSTCAEISTIVRVLNEQLESLAYPVHSYSSIYGGLDSGGKKEDDEIARIKAEIRGVKGVLLSARNFKAPTRGFVGPNGVFAS